MKINFYNCLMLFIVQAVFLALLVGIACTVKASSVDYDDMENKETLSENGPTLSDHGESVSPDKENVNNAAENSNTIQESVGAVGQDLYISDELGQRILDYLDLIVKILIVTFIFACAGVGVYLAGIVADWFIQ